MKRTLLHVAALALWLAGLALCGVPINALADAACTDGDPDGCCIDRFAREVEVGEPNAELACNIGPDDVPDDVKSCINNSCNKSGITNWVNCDCDEGDPEDECERGVVPVTKDTHRYSSRCTGACICIIVRETVKAGEAQVIDCDTSGDMCNE